MRLLRQAWLLTRNDLRQELRNFELVLTSGFFTFVLLIMFALAFDNLSETAQHKAVPGMVWLSVAFIGVLTLTRVFDRERESQTLGALLVAPTERLAIYLAKVVFTVLVLSLCAAIMVPGLVLIFPGAAGFAARPAATALLILLGLVAYAAIGTLFAAGLATSTGKNVLLSIILYPLTTPVLLFGLVATQRLLEGHPGLDRALAEMAGVDLILLAVGGFLFESVLVGTTRRRP